MFILAVVSEPALANTPHKGWSLIRPLPVTHALTDDFNVQQVHTATANCICLDAAVMLVVSYTVDA
jgi:hypothetical protein